LRRCSATAATETAELIAESIKKGDSGVAVVEEVSQVLDKIGESVNKVAVNVGEVAAASENKRASQPAAGSTNANYRFDQQSKSARKQPAAKSHPQKAGGIQEVVRPDEVIPLDDDKTLANF